MTKTSGRLLATTLVVWLAGASAVRSEYLGWTYSFEDSGLTISPNGTGDPNAPPVNTSGSIGIALPPGSTTGPLPPGVSDASTVILKAATSALGTVASPADQYTMAPYSVTLTINDTANKSHDFTFNGMLTGSLTTSSFQIANTFDGDSQDSIVGNHDYRVTVGPFALSQTTGAGSIGFAVQVNDLTVPVTPPGSPPPSSAPEPTSLILACLAIPALGARLWKRKRAVLTDV